MNVFLFMKVLKFHLHSFLARLHFSAEELLLYPGVGVRVGVRMQNVRANVSLGILSLSEFLLAF